MQNVLTMPLDDELQLALVKLCFQDHNFISSCQKYLKKNYFDNTYLGWIFNFVVDFYFKYHLSPSTDTIRNEILKFSPEERVPYEIMLNKITESKFKDFEYLKKEITTWTKKKYLFDNMQNFNNLYKSNKTEEAYDFMHATASELLNINYDQTQIFDYSRVDSILEYAKNSYKHKLKLGIKPLDDLMLGGVAKQNVCLFIGPMHSGKSIILINIARNFVEQGQKVLYIDLENDFRQLIIRMLASFAKVNYKNFFKTDGLSIAEKDKVIKARNLMESSLFIRSITDFSVYIESLIPEIKQLHLRHKFDAVIIDYSQILKVKDYSRMKRHEYLEEIMRGLSCMARDLDVVVLTAAQGNREGQKKVQKGKGMKDTMEMTDIGDSFALTRVVNPILTITKSEDDDRKNRIRIKLGKNRDGGTNVIAACEVDFETCRIFSDELVCKIMREDESDDITTNLSYLDTILKETVPSIEDNSIANGDSSLKIPY